MTVRSILRLFTVAVLLLAVLALSRDILDVRLGDLDYLLTRASRESSEPHAAGLLGRYELIRRRLLSGEGGLDQYELEARIAAVTSEVRFDADAPVPSDASPPARLIVATLRTILGKEPIQAEAESAFLPRLEEAYFLERIRDYASAERMYAALLEEEQLPASLRPTVELHRAFCLSMLGSHSEAGSEYTRIAGTYGGTETAFLARRLSYLLAEIRTTRELEPVGDDATAASFDAGVEAYLRMDYRRAEERLAAFLAGATTPARALVPKHEAEGRYYLGRALEEQGRIEEALEQYDRVGWLAPDSRWANESARRLVMISEFYRLAGTDAERTGDVVVDREFRDRIRPYEPLVVRRARRGGNRTAADGQGGQGSGPGSLWLRSAPSGAEVSISGRPVGRTPLILDGIEAGTVEVELRAGRGRAQALIEVPAGGRAVRDLSLSFPSPTGGVGEASETAGSRPRPLPFRDGPEARGRSADVGRGAEDAEAGDGELGALDARIAELVSRRDALRRDASISGSGLDRGRAASLGIGAVGAGVGGVLYVLSQLSYGNYEQADSADEAVRYREQTIARSRGAVAGVLVAGAGLLVGSVLGYLDDRRDDRAEQLHDIEAELQRLRNRREVLLARDP